VAANHPDTLIIMQIAVYEEFHRYLHVEMKTCGKSSVIIKYSPHVRVSIEWSGVL